MRADTSRSAVNAVVRTHFGRGFTPEYVELSAIGKEYDWSFGRHGRPFEGIRDEMYLGAEDDPQDREIPDPQDLDELVMLSLWSMVPEIKKRLSLVNSVYELKDLASLKHSGERLNNFVKQVGLKGGGRKSLISLLGLGVGVVADQYLQNRFNVAPLISDIRAIVSAMKDSSQLVKALEKSGKKVQTSHYVKFIPHEFADRIDEPSAEQEVNIYDVEPVQDSPFWYCHCSSTRSVFWEPSEFRAQIQFTAEFTEFQTANARLLSTLDELGVNLSPSIIWNAIPWSFVVDWIVGIGQFLDGYKVGWMEPRVKLLQYSWSIKRVRSVQTSAVFRHFVLSDLYRLVDDVVKLPLITETAYKRSVGLPEASLLESSGVSPGEWALAAALDYTSAQKLIVRRRNKRRRRRSGWWRKHHRLSRIGVKTSLGNLKP